MTRRPGLLSAMAAGTPGLRRIRRPADDAGPTFDLAYVRTGPRTARPTVVVPGGPGLGSVLPYRGLRRRAARLGLDLIMVEHRGVGLSRTDTAGRDLPVDAMRISAVAGDIAAVLDREAVDSAFLAGSSYGSYVVSFFGARYPERVAGILLDSALQSSTDIGVERQAVRSLFWDADTQIAADVRHLYAGGVDRRRLLDVIRAAHELGGPQLLGPLLRQRLRRPGGAAWRILEAYATRDGSIATLPGIYEFDIAGAIGFRELGYGAPPDGLPLDPALTYAPIAHRFPAFEGEPAELGEATSRFTWPMVLLSGDRDLRTPPSIAERVASIAPDATLTRLENGHSALDTHPAALLSAIAHLTTGRHESLPGRAGDLNSLPRRGASARVPGLLALLLRAERMLGGPPTRQ
ncbi:alpha/beta hydrolase [Dietzia sp. PP-33]|jgi:proline iminopeptidase|uniref:alpha/beta fold hydrolase n=1 Tax=Dietzia sp. PP-33 TaxID=2957500 RepID=UPI0029B51AF3|nr:alpha/beta hydrolase [Dietzia sp. PP-33]MDX2355447.1 alpha/beta hydrolase [Dietzia sp. PP-33]